MPFALSALTKYFVIFPKNPVGHSSSMYSFVVVVISFTHDVVSSLFV